MASKLGAEATASRQKAYAAGIGFTLIFCLHYLAASRLLVDLPAVVLGAWRGLGAGLLLSLLFFRHLAPLFARGLRWKTLSVGLLGFCLNQLLLLEGLKRSTPANAALITNCIPLVSTLLAFLIGKETPTSRQAAGLLLGFGALAGYFVWQNETALGLHLLGNALIFANVVSFCLALVLIKNLVGFASEVAVTAAMLTIGGAILAAAAGSSLFSSLAPVFQDGAKILLLAFEIFVVTIGGYFLNVYALKRLPVAATMSLNYLQPPLTAALGFVLIGQAVSVRILPLFLAVVVATWLVRPDPGRRG